MLLRWWELANSMEQSHVWETSSRQEVPHILWYVKVHYPFHNSQPSVPVLSQMYPIHRSCPISFKTDFNIIILCVPDISKQSLSFMFPTKSTYTFLSFDVCTTCATHLILLDLEFWENFMERFSVKERHINALSFHWSMPAVFEALLCSLKCVQQVNYSWPEYVLWPMLNGKKELMGS